MGMYLSSLLSIYLKITLELRHIHMWLYHTFLQLLFYYEYFQYQIVFNSCLEFHLIDIS